MSLNDELIHYGTKRHSGRYPWGSGDEPYQHSGDFLSRVKALEKEGLSDVKIAEHFGMSTTDFRREKTIAGYERRYLEIEKAKSLREKGYSNYKIGEMMGKNESSIRSMLDKHPPVRMEQAKATAELLKQQVAEKKYIDVGDEAEKYLGVSRARLDEALYMLEMEGYQINNRYIEQRTNKGKNITYKTLCPPDTDFEDFRNTYDIKPITDFKSQDGGDSFQPRNVYPKSMDSKRLQIRYAEDGGIQKDGIIELRRGVEDLDLGNSRYAQVRILVDNDRYLKGMAVYSDDMPDGVDVIFNTNKTKDKPMRDVLKEIKDDPNNPFGSSIKSIEDGGQYYYTDKNGKQQLGLINKRSDEGDWDDWSNNLPSQFLSKQPLKLAEKQLNLAFDKRNAEFEEICSLTNPTVKKKLLEDFAEGCDSSAVHLKAAALPRQQFHVIIPMPSLKDDEIYAPNYNDGETLALIRYPHGGTFEIPIVKVNNRHAECVKLLGKDVPDAVAINNKVAERLSGADFDGDTVMVIPTNDKVKIKSTNKLFDDFDPKLEYGTTKRVTKNEDGTETTEYINRYGQPIKVMKDTGKQMGVISNLITDMTLMGATDDEKARAVKHSMVVIDAEKHCLDWKTSEKVNGIKELKETYQAKYNEETGRYQYGASTLISRAKSEVSVTKRQGLPKTNIKGEEWYDPSKPEGAKIYKTHKDAHYADFVMDTTNNKVGYRLTNGKKVMYDPNDKDAVDYYRPAKKKDPDTGEVTFTNKTGELTYKVKTRKQQSTRMEETDDAFDLVSDFDTPMERAYATYANKMKSLANQARKEIAITEDIKISNSAKKVYEQEVKDLEDKLNEAVMNTPRERHAQVLAASEVNAIVQENKNMSKSDLKKLNQRALERARTSVGAKRKKIEITDKEWEAIQSGAFAATKLKELLKYADMDVVRTKAMPRSNKATLSSAQSSSLLSKWKTGRYTLAQLADFYNVPTSTVSNIVKGKEN